MILKFKVQTVTLNLQSADALSFFKPEFCTQCLKAQSSTGSVNLAVVILF